MPPVEAWAKVAVDTAFADTTHGAIACTDCHGGDGAADTMDVAHEGIVRDPDPTATCGDCHEAETADHAGSLHSTLAGYTTVLTARSSPEKMPQVMEAYDNHCASCHTSCGQCHVSRPTSAGGGLLSGHEFRATPPMNLTCTGWPRQPGRQRVQGQERDRRRDRTTGRCPLQPRRNGLFRLPFRG